MKSERDYEILFKKWWEEHRGIFHKIARSFAAIEADEADEADLLQEMLVQLWRSLPGYRTECRPSTWIYRVCFNTALGWKRGESRRLRRFLPEEARGDAACRELQPDERREKTELLAALYEAIKKLPPTERSLVLMLLDGVSYREMSGVTGLTENHVGMVLTRARKKLMKLLEETR